MTGARVRTDRSAARLALAGYACLFAGGFSDNARGPLIPMIIDTFHISTARASLLPALGSLAGLAGGLLAGALVARFGPRATLRVTASSGAIGLLLVALAGALGEFLIVPVGAVLIGVGLAGLGVTANVYVTLSASPETRARALARLHVMYALASLIVPQVVVRASLVQPWPRVLAGAAIVPLLLLPLSLLVPWTGSGPAAERQESSGRGSVALYALAISLFVVAEVSVSLWLTLFAERTTSWDPGARAALLSGFFAGLGAARLAGGALLTERRVKPAILIAAVAAALAAVLGLHVHPVFLSVVGLCVGILFPATMSVLTLEVPAERHGKAIGAVTASFSVALFLAHTFVGEVSDRVDIRAALHLSPACALAGAAVLAWGWRRAR